MSSKSEEARTRDAQATDEEKATLPVGHPEAGYVSPDLSYSDGAGTLPDSEKQWNAARDKAHDEEVEAVADAEDKAVKEQKKAEEKAAAEEKDAPAPKKAAASGSGS